MKLLLLSIVVAVAAAAQTDPDFTAFLNQIFGHASFQRLPDEDRLLFSELVMAAEQHELEMFIDRIGLLKVIELVDHLGDADAHTFAGYLAEHMNYDVHSEGWAHLQGWLNGRGNNGKVHGNKRQLSDDAEDHWTTFERLLHDLSRQHYFQRLPTAERHTFEGLLTAVTTRTLDQFIDKVGYGAIFGLLNVLDPVHANEVYTFMEIGLRQTQQ